MMTANNDDVDGVVAVVVDGDGDGGYVMAMVIVKPWFIRNWRSL